MAIATDTVVDTLVFDIDDTLYDVASGFTWYRNTEVVVDFMMANLGFDDRNVARSLRDEYFDRYHTSVKGLQVAEEEGRLPEGHTFRAADLSAWLETNCDFARFLRPIPQFREDLEACNLKKIIFTNGPRAYGKAVLNALGLEGLFTEDDIYGVEDVLRLGATAPKPHEEAFLKVLEAAGTRPERAVMFEDSMKNIRAAKAIGMRTVLVTGTSDDAAGKSDPPDPSDPAVDVTIQTISQLKAALPSLWGTQPTFSPAITSP